MNAKFWLTGHPQQRFISFILLTLMVDCDFVKSVWVHFDKTFVLLEIKNILGKARWVALVVRGLTAIKFANYCLKIDMLRSILAN